MSPVTTELPLDHDELIQRFDGDRLFVVSLFEEFFQTEAERLAALEAAIARGNALQVKEQAHSFRSSLLGLSACSSAVAALDLEIAGRNSDLSNATALLETLKTELGRFRQEAVRTELWKAE